MPESTQKKCSRCSVLESEATLIRCPICHKMVCEDCIYRRSGSNFCGRFCAEFFFFEGEDEDEES